jgi:LPS O-antigen subunit length determinant protein (WzzB/FepE family)
MKGNMKIPNSDDIDLKILILSLWKEKYLFLSITLLFLFLGYLYSLTLNKNIEFTSRIKTTPLLLNFLQLMKLSLRKLIFLLEGKILQ